MWIPTAVELYSQRSIAVSSPFLPLRFWSPLLHLDSQIIFFQTIQMMLLTCQLKIALYQQILFVPIQKKCYTGMLCCPSRTCFWKVWHLKSLPHCFTLHPQLTWSMPVCLRKMMTTLKVQLFRKRQQQRSHWKTDIGDLVSGMKQLGSLRRVIFSRKLPSLPGDSSDSALTTPSTMPYILCL